MCCRSRIVRCGIGRWTGRRRLRGNATGASSVRKGLGISSHACGTHSARAGAGAIFGPATRRHAHLHISLRLFISAFLSAMSEGLPLCCGCRRMIFRAATEYVAAATTCRTSEPAVIDPNRRSADGYGYGGYTLDSCEPGAAVWRVPRRDGFARAGACVAEPDSRGAAAVVRRWSVWMEEQAALEPVAPIRRRLMFHDEGALGRCWSAARRG